MPKYTVVLGPVEHDGKAYADGTRLEMPEALAAPLVAVGAVAPAGKAAAPAPAPAPAPASAPAPAPAPEGDTSPPPEA